MRSGIIYITVETYESRKAFIDLSPDSNLQHVFDTVNMKMPSIVSIFSVDIDGEFRAIFDKLVKHGLVDDDKKLKNVELAIDIFTDFFKNKLSDNVAQDIDEDTRRMMDEMLRE